MNDELFSRCIDKMLTMSVKARKSFELQEYRYKFENEADIELKDIFEYLHEKTIEDLSECGITIKEDMGDIVGQWHKFESIIDLYGILFPTGMLKILREDDIFRNCVNDILTDMNDSVDSKLDQYLDLINSDKCLYKDTYEEAAEQFKSVVGSSEIFDNYLQDIYDQCMNVPMESIDEGFMIKYIAKLRNTRRNVLRHINTLIQKKLVSVTYGDHLEIDLFNSVRGLSSNEGVLKQFSWCEHVFENSVDENDIKVAKQLKKSILLNFPLDFLHLTQLSIIDDSFNMETVKKYAILMVLWKAENDNVSLKESMQLFTDHVTSLLPNENNLTILNGLIEISAAIKPLYVEE